MKIALAQLNPVIGDIQGNCAKALHHAHLAYKSGVDLIIFPELFISGYPPLDLLLQQGFVERCESALNELVKELPPCACIIGLPTNNKSIQGKHHKNSVAIIEKNTITGMQHKALLPTYDVFDEARYFSEGEALTHTILGKKIGVLICEDMWAKVPLQEKVLYNIDPLNNFQQNPLDLVVVISASPYNVHKPAIRELLLKDINSHCKCPVASVNQVGAQDGLLFDGNSCYVHRNGNIERAKSFDEEVFIPGESIASPLLTNFAELEKGLVLGIRDYFWKLGFKQALIGLSGGVDSSLVAYLATQALGSKNVFGVLLPSRYTSKESNEDALELARRLDIKTSTFSIESSLEAITQTIKYTPKSQDLPFENMQSRVRGLLLMSLSNIHGSLVLCTSNKSELAVGYSTLYGDSCGALAPIGDLLKTELYSLCKEINHRKSVFPESVLTKAPTAELRPGQTDQESLPPYEILDSIITELVVNKRSVLETATRLHMPTDLVADISRKIQRAEYKRRQAPLILRVSSCAFNVGRVVPIVEKSR